MVGITGHKDEGVHKYSGKHLLPSPNPHSQEAQDEYEREPSLTSTSWKETDGLTLWVVPFALF